MIRFATEDVGNADPMALLIANQAMESYRFLGSPEGELALAQAALYLASAPKSNAVYKAFGLFCGGQDSRKLVVARGIFIKFLKT